MLDAFNAKWIFIVFRAEELIGEALLLERQPLDPELRAGILASYETDLLEMSTGSQNLKMYSHFLAFDSKVLRSVSKHFLWFSLRTRRESCLGSCLGWRLHDPKIDEIGARQCAVHCHGEKRSLQKKCLPAMVTGALFRRPVYGRQRAVLVAWQRKRCQEFSLTAGSQNRAPAWQVEAHGMLGATSLCESRSFFFSAFAGIAWIFATFQANSDASRLHPAVLLSTWQKYDSQSTHRTHILDLADIKIDHLPFPLHTA